MKAPGIRCKELAEQANDHVEGDQSWSNWALFRFHILMCTDCRAYLRQMQTTVATLARMPGEPLPVEVGDDLMRRYREWQTAREV